MLDEVRAEIESLHAFFVEWFAGHCEHDRAVFDERVIGRMTDNFELIQPNGQRHSRAAIGEAIFAGYATNPEFRIAIRNLDLRVVDPTWILATYEEWQRNAVNSTPPDNGRLSTALFRRQGSELSWVHVHETWLPSDVQASSSFDF